MARKLRNTEYEKQAIKDGKSAQEIRPDEPAKAAHKDAAARVERDFEVALDQGAHLLRLQIANVVVPRRQHLRCRS